MHHQPALGPRLRVMLLLLALAAVGCATENPSTTRAASDVPAAPAAPTAPPVPASPTAGPATAIALSPPSFTVLAGASPFPFVAQTKDANGRDVPLPATASPTWSVTPGTGTGTIDANGVFTPGNPGGVTVNAAAGGLAAKAPVVIISSPYAGLAIVLPSPSPTPTPTPTPTPSAIPTGSVSPTPTPTPSAAAGLTVVSGGVIPLAATATRAGASPEPVTPAWAVSPAPNAYVDEDGNLRAFIAGTLTLFASVPNATAQTSITVIPGPAELVFVSGASGALGVGAPIQLAATGRDRLNNTISPLAVQWSLDPASTGVATIDANGLLSPVSPGTLLIRVQAGQLSGTLDLLLLQPLVTAVGPYLGRVGDVIAISGSGFGAGPGGGLTVTTCPAGGVTATGSPNLAASPLPAGASAVVFSDGQNPTVPANEVICWSDTFVQVRVPDGARPGPLAVRVGSFTSNTVPFTRLFGINAP